MKKDRVIQLSLDKNNKNMNIQLWMEPKAKKENRNTQL